MLTKSRRYFRRYREIAGILARNGWGWALERVGLGEHAAEHGEMSRLEDGALHLRQMLEELGPTFIKLGQLLSTRPDIVPHAYIKELSKLQDTAPTFPTEEACRVIEEDFETPASEQYAEFDRTPLAAASLAQVHRAVLHDGTPVIVKVQRPGIRQQIEADLDIIYHRAKFLENHWERARIYGVTDIVDEFALTLREELDFTREGRNTDHLRETLVNNPHVKVPQVYWNVTSGRVLTLQQMQGIKITELPAHPFPGVDPKEVSNRLAAAFLEQVLVEGFFHADPHPGNVLVNEQGDILLVDCGQALRLEAAIKSGTIRLLLAFEERNTRLLAEELLQIGAPQQEVDLRRLSADMYKVLRTYYDAPARGVNIGELLTRLLNVSADHRIRLPASFATLAKVFTNVEGICRTLNPDFNFTEALRPYLAKAVRRELRSEDTLADLYRALSGLRSFLVTMPENLERVLHRMVEGKLRLEFKHQGLEQLTHTFQAGANRISIALVVGATIVGSSLIVLAGRGPKSWLGLPALGVLGYLIAMLFGSWLIVSILRSGRHK